MINFSHLLIPNSIFTQKATIQIPSNTKIKSIEYSLINLYYLFSLQDCVLFVKYLFYHLLINSSILFIDLYYCYYLYLLNLSQTYHLLFVMVPDLSDKSNQDDSNKPVSGHQARKTLDPMAFQESQDHLPHRKLKSEILNPTDVLANPPDEDKQMDSVERHRVGMSETQIAKTSQRNQKTVQKASKKKDSSPQKKQLQSLKEQNKGQNREEELVVASEQKVKKESKISKKSGSKTLDNLERSKSKSTKVSKNKNLKRSIEPDNSGLQNEEEVSHAMSTRSKKSRKKTMKSSQQNN